MKKVITILLVLTMVMLAFVGCSKEGADTKEAPSQASSTMDELLAQAVEADMATIDSDIEENLVRAKENYCNKVLKMDGVVFEIKEDYVVLGSKNGTYNYMDVYLSKEDIVKLETTQRIIVVGKTSDEVKETANNSPEASLHFQMQDAYIVQDSFEVVGTLGGKDNYYKTEYKLVVDGEFYPYYVEFAEDFDVSSVQQKQIQFTAKCKVYDQNYHFFDVENVEAI